MAMRASCVARSSRRSGDAAPAYRVDEKALIAAFDMIDLDTALDQALVDKRRTRSTTETALSGRIYTHLEKYLRAPANA